MSGQGSIIENLKAMRFSAMAREYEVQLESSHAYQNLGFEDRFGFLVDAEWNKRQANKLNRFIRNACFSNNNASIENIEYLEDRKLDKGQIIRFATCQYIEDGHHIILMGASGSGKTYIACALGIAACRKFKKVKYIRMPELLDEVKVAISSGTLKKLIAVYTKLDLLILDEWLLRSLSGDEAYHILEIVEAREHRSTIFCTQFDSKGWLERINSSTDGESPLSDSVIDRIVHNSYKVPIYGLKSMRERHGIKGDE